MVVDLPQLQEYIIEKAQAKDRPFLELFLETQMFVIFVEECYNPKVNLNID